MPPRGGKSSSGAVFARVHAWVAKIPRGKVVTYGQLSQLVGRRLSAVGVGWALRAGPATLPWYRVVNAQGGLSTEAEQPGRQRALLLREGVQFGLDGRIDMARHQWSPGGAPGGKSGASRGRGVAPRGKSVAPRGKGAAPRGKGVGLRREK
jgi:methylated-DNA-protein-cysteine methyltransferase-like protein